MLRPCQREWYHVNQPKLMAKTAMRLSWRTPFCFPKVAGRYIASYRGPCQVVCLMLVMVLTVLVCERNVKLDALV